MQVGAERTQAQYEQYQRDMVEALRANNAHHHEEVSLSLLGAKSMQAFPTRSGSWE